MPFVSLFFANFAKFFVKTFGKINKKCIFLRIFNVSHNKKKKFTFNSMNCVKKSGMHQ